MVTSTDGLQRRIPNIKDNHTSIVLSIRVAGQNVLLGADLLVREDRSLGWHAIIDEHDGTIHDVFKVSHHGSGNGDCSAIWEKLMGPCPVSITTPFVGGDVRLPKPEDCERILERSPNALMTARPTKGKFRLSDRAAEKAFQEVAKQAQFVPSNFGHVRLRRKIEAASVGWRVDMFGHAIAMKDYVREIHSQTRSR
jgi:hypothetical protein